MWDLRVHLLECVKSINEQRQLILASHWILIKEPITPSEVLHFTICVCVCYIMPLQVSHDNTKWPVSVASLILCAIIGTSGIREVTWSSVPHTMEYEPFAMAMLSEI